MKGVFPFALGVLCGGLVTLASLAAFRHYQGKQSIPAVVANGEVIPLRALLDSLTLKYGAGELEELTLQKLVEQEAHRLNLTLTESESKALEHSAQQVVLPELRGRALAAATSRLLERKVLLAGIKESQVQEVYAMFSQELSQYDLSVALLASREDARQMFERVRAGTDFAILAKENSLDPSRFREGKIGFLTSPQIQSWLGREAAQQVSQLKDGETGAPLFSRQGWCLIQVASRRTTFAQLRPSCEQLLIGSSAPELRHRLLKSAKLESPYLRFKSKEAAKE